MTLVPTIVPAASISSLMVGVMTKDDTTPPRLEVRHCQSLTVSSSSSTTSSAASASASAAASREVDSQDDNWIEEFRRVIRKAWLEKAPIVAGAVAVTSTGETKEEDEEPCANPLLEKLLRDEAQLDRILVARKYEMDACVSLFFEQFRFRAKWKPQSIQPEDIPNALPCKLHEIMEFSADDSNDVKRGAMSVPMFKVSYC